MLEKALMYNIINEFVSYILQQEIQDKDLFFHIMEKDIKVVDKDLEEKMRQYEFSGMSINPNIQSRDIKTNPMEKMKCIYVNKLGTLFFDLLTWARKTFPTEITNTLDVVLKRCGLEGKIDLPYIPKDDDI